MPLLSQGGALSLSGGFVKVNLLFMPVVAIVAFVIPAFCKSKLAGDMLAAFPVSVEFVPYFILTVTVFGHWVMSACKGMAASIMTQEGYNNGNPRMSKGEGVLGRMHSAALNGFEANGYAACMVLVGSKLPTCGRGVTDPCISQDLFARLTLLYLLTRCVYYPVYAMDLDSVRSTVWLTGLCSLVAIGAAPFFGFTEYLQ